MIFFISCGGKQKADPGTYFDKASEYNSYITVRFDEVNRLWNACLSVMDDSTLIYKQLDTLRETSRQSMLDMNNLADFKGDTGYKHAAGEYFRYMLSICDGSYKKAIDIGLEDDLPDSLYVQYMAISNQIGADKDTCINHLKTAQLRFVELTNKE